MSNWMRALGALAALGLAAATVHAQHRAAPRPTEVETPAGNTDAVAPRINSLSPLPAGRIVDNLGLSTLAIGFTEVVLIPEGSVRVRDLSGDGVGIAAQWFDDATSTLHLELDRQVRADVIDVIIDYALTDLAGNELDGEVLNPASPTLPTGDGVRGGTAVFRYEVLQGDADRDGVVDLNDGVLISQALGTSAGMPGYDALADLNGDGVINVLDVAIWAGGVGNALPAVSATPPVVISIDPPTADPLVEPLTLVRVGFSRALDGREFGIPALYLTSQSGQLIPATSAELIDGGLAAVFGFEGVFDCGRFTITLSNALTDGTGALLSLTTPKPRYDALVPPPTPTLDAFTTMTTAVTADLAGLAPRGVTVEVTGPGGLASAAVGPDGSFQLQAPLRANAVNTLFISSISACGVRSAPVTAQVIMDIQPPDLHIDFPADGAQIQADTTDVAGRVADLHSGFNGLTVLVNGVPAEVDIGIGTNGTFFLPSFPLSDSGTTTITAVATDILGNTRTRSIAVQKIEIPAGSPRMELVSGNGQTGMVGQFLPQPVTVRVLNGNGTPMANKVVTFTVTRSDGVLAPQAYAEGSLVYQALSNAQGIARAFWRLGTDSGCGNNRLSVTSRDIAGTVELCASAMPRPASQINIGTGNSQRAETGAPLPLPLRVYVNDGCNGVANLPIEFSVVAGDGLFPNGASSIIVPTGPTGHAQTGFTLGPTPGSNRVRATFPGNPTAPAEFVLTGLERVEDRPTSFTGLVLDNASRPIKDAMIRLVINGVQAGITYSNIQGQFSFSGFEGSGMADLYVNGAVATGVGGPDNFEPVGPLTFPLLHYETVVVANAANSLGTPVLLPRMNPANVRHYSTTQPTILECEGVEGLRMIIQPGSMTMPNGSPAPNGQMMSLNQVHHDDIPMPMPDGAAPPFAWTIWPPEATFDPPITVEYPNMSGLAPGSIAYFLTFDHATGKFEIVSSGSVTPDGSTIVTDPGSGLTLSGWGCNCPPYAVTGDCEPCKIEGPDALAVLDRDELVMNTGGRSGTYTWRRLTGSSAAFQGDTDGVRVQIETTAFPSSAVRDHQFECVFEAPDGFRCSARHELTVASFALVADPGQGILGKICDGASLRARLVPFPFGLETLVFDRLGEFSLRAVPTTPPLSSPNPAGTTEHAFSPLSIPDYTSTILRALWYATMPSTCNQDAAYELSASATVTATGSSADSILVLQGAAISSFVVSTRTVASQAGGDPCVVGCMNASAWPLSYFSGQFAADPIERPDGLWEVNATIGTFRRDVIATVATCVHPNSQFADMILAEEQFHKGQFEGTTSSILQHLWNPQEVLQLTLGRGPYIDSTPDGAVTQFRIAAAQAQHEIEVRDLGLTSPGSPLGCAMEQEAKDFVGFVFRFTMPCSYPQCP